MEGSTEGIADDLKDEAIVRPDGPAQDLMVPRQESRQCLRILLGKPGAALDIGKEKSNRAAGNGDTASADDDVLWHKYEHLQMTL
jgi:hypothetical protein